MTAVEPAFGDVLPMLENMRTGGDWDFAYYPNREWVEALAVFRDFADTGISDVIIIKSKLYAYGYRGVCEQSTDRFAPNFILWENSDIPFLVLRAAQALLWPGEPGAFEIKRIVPARLTVIAEPFTRERVQRPHQ